MNNIPEDPETFETLPSELLIEIVLNLPSKEILRLCKVSQHFNQTICQQDIGYLWKSLYRRDILGPSSPGINSQIPENARQEYIRIITEFNNIAETDQSQRSLIKKQLENSIKNNYRLKMEEILKTYPGYIGDALVYAAKYGRQDIFDDMIKRGLTTSSNLIKALFGAVSGGHLDLVKQIIDRIEGPIKQSDINEAGRLAALNGNRDILDYLLRQYKAYINTALYGAARGGHTDIVTDLINQGANGYNGALLEAAEGGFLDIVTILLDRGVSSYDMALNAAATNGYPDIVIELLDRGRADGYLTTENAHDIMYVAALNNQSNVIDALIQYGVKDLSRALLGAIQGDHPNLVFELLDRSPARLSQKALELAAYRGLSVLVGELIQRGLDNNIELNLDSAMAEAASGGNISIIDNLVERGARDFDSAISGAELKRPDNVSNIRRHLRKLKNQYK